jgi:hypothetical protein
MLGSSQGLVFAQSRIIRSASATLSVPKMALARSLSDGSVHSSIIQVVHHGSPSASKSNSGFGPRVPRSRLTWTLCVSVSS